jgi:hypothetical protein
MRVAEVIRNILDVLDTLDQYEQEEQAAFSASPYDKEAAIRTQQIQDLLDKTPSSLANSPNEQYADINAVIASGTDVNKSKHPADIRTNATSMYPSKQWNGE